MEHQPIMEETVSDGDREEDTLHVLQQYADLVLAQYDNTPSIRLAEDARVGRHLVAARDLTAGEVILRERHAIAAPKTAGVCVACLRRAAGGAGCAGCGWPLCDACAAARPPPPPAALHPECALLAALRPQRPWQRWPAPGAVLMVLRALLLRTSDPQLFRTVDVLQDNLPQLAATPWLAACAETVLPPVRSVCGDDDVTARTVAHLAAVLDTNSFAVSTAGGGLATRALFPLLCLMTHDCSPNTNRFHDGDMCTLVATRRIGAGEMVTTSYTSTLWGTDTRRTHLAATKFFQCTCRRCEDPTEFGTDVTAIRCRVGPAPTDATDAKPRTFAARSDCELSSSTSSSHNETAASPPASEATVVTSAAPSDNGPPPSAAPSDSGAPPPAAPSDSGPAPPAAPSDSGAPPSAAPSDNGPPPSAAPSDSGAPPSAAPSDSGPPPPAAPSDSGASPPAAPSDSGAPPPAAPSDSGPAPPAAPSDSGAPPPAAPSDNGPPPAARAAPLQAGCPGLRRCRRAADGALQWRCDRCQAVTSAQQVRLTGQLLAVTLGRTLGGRQLARAERWEAAHRQVLGPNHHFLLEARLLLLELYAENAAGESAEIGQLRDAAAAGTRRPTTDDDVDADGSPAGVDDDGATISDSDDTNSHNNNNNYKNGRHSGGDAPGCGAAQRTRAQQRRRRQLSHQLLTVTSQMEPGPTRLTGRLLCHWVESCILAGDFTQADVPLLLERAADAVHILRYDGVLRPVSERVLQLARATATAHAP